MCMLYLISISFLYNFVNFLLLLFVWRCDFVPSCCRWWSDSFLSFARGIRWISFFFKFFHPYSFAQIVLCILIDTMPHSSCLCLCWRKKKFSKSYYLFKLLSSFFIRWQCNQSIWIILCCCRFFSLSVSFSWFLFVLFSVGMHSWVLLLSFFFVSVLSLSSHLISSSNRI